MMCIESFAFQPFKQPLCVEEYLLKYAKTYTDDLTLRRYSAVDALDPLPPVVTCPYQHCTFGPTRGVDMVNHQRTAKHPGFDRYSPGNLAKNWLCPQSTCCHYFNTWNELYLHMQCHTKPLQCVACEYRTGKKSNLTKHCRNVHPGVSLPNVGHWSRRGSSILRPIN